MRLRESISLLRRHRLGWMGGIILIILYLGAIFADFLSPYPYDMAVKEKSYHPPVRVHFLDKKGKFHLLPFVYNYQLKIDPLTRKKVYLPDTSKIYPVKFFFRGKPHRILGLFPTRLRLFGVDPPAHIFLLGSDVYGRDIFSRLLYGSRVSLSIGLVGVLITFSLGLLVGGVAGYFGGVVDSLVMRICELIMMLPGFYLLLALRAAFPPGLSSIQVYFLIVLILSFIGWAGLARVIRGIVLSISQQEFVLAAKALGVSTPRLIFKHILPNTFSYSIVAATLAIPSYILGESALSLLGLGIQEPQASWGNMLSEAMNIGSLTAHPWILVPGAFIFLAVLSFNFLGDGLRDLLDPYHRILR